MTLQTHGSHQVGCNHSFQGLTLNQSLRLAGQPLVGNFRYITLLSHFVYFILDMILLDLHFNESPINISILVKQLRSAPQEEVSTSRLA